MRIRRLEARDVDAAQMICTAQCNSFFPFWRDAAPTTPDDPNFAASYVVEEAGEAVAILTARVVYEVDVHVMPGRAHQAQQILALVRRLRKTLRGLSRNLFRMGLAAPTTVIVQTTEQLPRMCELLERIGFAPQPKVIRWFRTEL